MFCKILCIYLCFCVKGVMLLIYMVVVGDKMEIMCIYELMLVLILSCKKY